MISVALAKACPHLFMVNEALYESEEMQTGIDHEALTKWAPTLIKPLVELDARGGIFSQADIHDALTKEANKEQNKVHVEKTAAERKMSVTMFFIAHGSWKNCLVIWMSDVRQRLTRTDISGSGNA